MGYSVAQMLVNIIFIWVYLQVKMKMKVYLHVIAMAGINKTVLYVYMLGSVNLSQ